jgi:hypothetical protein
VTRDKGKWTHTPADPYYSGKLLLPSFGIEVDGIEVTRSAPRSKVYLEGDGIEDLICDSGDAFSISYLGPQSEATTVDRRFMGLDQAYIRRVLLLILDGEEYDDILLHYTAHYPREFKPDVPKGKPLDLRDLREREDPDPKAQVRITDLRLAKDLGRKDPGRRKLRSELRAEVSELRLPFTTDDVLRWKWKTLLKPKRHRKVSEVKEKKEWYEEECLRIRAISFAAAALCLSVDLGLRIPEESSRDDLTEIILGWHTLISKLMSALDKAVGEASKLLSGRKGTKGGRPPDPQLKFYTALVLYRMGHSPIDIAMRMRREDDTAHERFSDNWKGDLTKAIKKGIKIEQEMFPLAAEVFSRRDEKKVREAALSAYANYDDHYPRGPENVSVALEDGSDLIGMPANEIEQMQNALIQLGYCIKWGLDPLSPNLS